MVEVYVFWVALSLIGSLPEVSMLMTMYHLPKACTYALCIVAVYVFWVALSLIGSLPEVSMLMTMYHLPKARSLYFANG